MTRRAHKLSPFAIYEQQGNIPMAEHCARQDIERAQARARLEKGEISEHDYAALCMRQVRQNMDIFLENQARFRRAPNYPKP